MVYKKNYGLDKNGRLKGLKDYKHHHTNYYSQNEYKKLQEAQNTLYGSHGTLFMAQFYCDVCGRLFSSGYEYMNGTKLCSRCKTNVEGRPSPKIIYTPMGNSSKGGRH